MTTPRTQDTIDRDTLGDKPTEARPQTAHGERWLQVYDDHGDELLVELREPIEPGGMDEFIEALARIVADLCAVASDAAEPATHACPARERAA